MEIENDSSSQIRWPSGSAVSHKAPASAALPISAPPRLRVSRFDARGDAEHAERWRMKCLLSLACSILSNKTNRCENCYNPVCAACCRADGLWI